MPRPRWLRRLQRRPVTEEEVLAEIQKRIPGVQAQIRQIQAWPLTHPDRERVLAACQLVLEHLYQARRMLLSPSPSCDEPMYGSTNDSIDRH